MGISGFKSSVGIGDSATAMRSHAVGGIEKGARRCTYSAFAGRPQHSGQNLSSKGGGVSG